MPVITRQVKTGRSSHARERAALVGLALRRSRRVDVEHSLDELAGLAEAAGAAVVLTMIQERPTPDPARLNTDLFPRDEFYLNEPAY